MLQEETLEDHMHETGVDAACAAILAVILIGEGRNSGK